MPRRGYRNIRNKVKPWKEAAARKMAKNLNAGEQRLWDKLKDKQLGVWAYKQKIVLGYIVDYWIPSAGLVVEIDGPCHAKRKAYDAKRDGVLRRKGIVTMRVSTNEVWTNLPAVVVLIKAKTKQRMR